MNRQSGYKIMSKLITLIKPLIHYIIFAVVMGVLGFLCAIFIPVFGAVSYTHLDVYKRQILPAVFTSDSVRSMFLASSPVGM